MNYTIFMYRKDLECGYKIDFVFLKEAKKEFNKLAHSEDFEYLYIVENKTGEIYATFGNIDTDIIETYKFILVKNNNIIDTRFVRFKKDTKNLELYKEKLLSVQNNTECFYTKIKN